ncbi:HTH-type transcriptional regulator SinR [Clostridium botulinum C str. Eklund]|nr:HTH-type transcriptional regulator SinR [Clostridium botulinum C str. Eklund]NEZ49831.1 helix-turn-helix transcriptional regulator [Clostridium botulinum]
MLGDNIKAFRKEKGMSLNKLAKSAGMSPSYLSDLENNKSVNPSMEKLNKLAEILEVRIEDFYKEDSDEIDKLEEEMKLLYSKIKNLSKNDRKKILDIIEQFEEETDR